MYVYVLESPSFKEYKRKSPLLFVLNFLFFFLFYYFLFYIIYTNYLFGVVGPLNNTLIVFQIKKKKKKYLCMSSETKDNIEI